MPEQTNPYQTAAEILLRESGCTVRKWRKNATGTAYTSSADWGIESPEPRGPISFAVFAHEVGHQMLHRHNSAPRWQEELEAWEYAVDQFSRFQLDAKGVRERMVRSLRYAAAKTSKRCSAETARALLDRYPKWIWTEGQIPSTYMDLAVKARGAQNTGTSDK